MSKGNSFVIDQDRYVDFISLSDLAKVTNFVIQENVTTKDFNVVYQEKILVSDMLRLFAKLHNIDPALVIVTGTKGKCYTGNSKLLTQYNISLDGLEKSLLTYQTKFSL